MAIVTKTGDKGTTGIFAGERVPKDDIRIEANGTMDELNAHLGYIRSQLPKGDERDSFLKGIQMQMMQLMSLIATPSVRRAENPNHFDPAWLTELELEIKRILSQTPSNCYFTLPGGTPISASLHLARTVCRRAERRLWTLERQDPLPLGLLPWVNRLSDYLFVAAKWEILQQNEAEELWQAFSYKRKRPQQP